MRIMPSAICAIYGRDCHSGRAVSRQAIASQAEG